MLCSSSVALYSKVEETPRGLCWIQSYLDPSILCPHPSELDTRTIICPPPPQQTSHTVPYSYWQNKIDLRDEPIAILSCTLQHADKCFKMANYITGIPENYCESRTLRYLE